MWEKASVADEEGVKCHSDTAGGDVRAQPLPDPGALPEGAEEPSLVAVEERGPERPEVGAGADQQQDDSQHRLEVEYGGHVSSHGSPHIRDQFCTATKLQKYSKISFLSLIKSTQI